MEPWKLPGRQIKLKHHLSNCQGFFLIIKHFSKMIKQVTAFSPPSLLQQSVVPVSDVKDAVGTLEQYKDQCLSQSHAKPEAWQCTHIFLACLSLNKQNF